MPRSVRCSIACDEFGIRSYLAHNMTVTPSNVEQIPEVIIASRALGFRMFSFQPAAYLGNERRWRDGYRALTDDDVWAQVQLGAETGLPFEAIAVGDLTTAVVNKAMVRELPGSTAVAGSDTWVSLPPTLSLVNGQKVDFEDTGLTVHTADGKSAPLAGTFLIAEIQGSSVRLMDNDHRRPVATTGVWNSQGAVVSTYRLVGPEYFNFFAYFHDTAFDSPCDHCASTRYRKYVFYRHQKWLIPELQDD